jgi:hypothetical protein
MKFGESLFQVCALIDFDSAFYALHCDILDKDMRRLRYNTGDLLRLGSRVYYGNGTAVAVT